MMERWCAWHKPGPILMGIIDDGQTGIIHTDGICEDCAEKFKNELRCDPTARDSKGFPLERDQLD